MVRETITNSDVRLLDDIVRLADVHRHPPGSETLFAVLGQLAQLVPCDWMALHLRQVATLRLEYCAAIAESVPSVFSGEELAEVDPRQEVMREWYWRGPWSLPERQNRPMTFSTSQAYSQRLWRTHPVHLEFFTGITDQVTTAYHTGSGRSVRVLGFRTCGTFSEREVLLLELLRPHLAPLMIAAVRGAAAPGGNVDGRSMLTPRQTDILRMVQSGLSNKQIGKALALSEGTVRKHLENAHRRLGAQSRTAAVGAAFGWGDSGAASSGGRNVEERHASSPAGAVGRARADDALPGGPGKGLTRTAAPRRPPPGS